MGDDASIEEKIATELAAAANLQRAAREAGDDNALAFASRRRWRALIAADPGVLMRGYAFVTGKVERLVSVSPARPIPYWRTGT